MPTLQERREAVGIRPSIIQGYAKLILQDLLHEDSEDEGLRDPGTSQVIYSENRNNRTVDIEIEGEKNLTDHQQYKINIELGEVEVPELLQSDRLRDKQLLLWSSVPLILRVISTAKRPAQDLASDLLYCLRVKMRQIENKYYLDKFVPLKMSECQQVSEDNPDLWQSAVQVKVEGQTVINIKQW